MGSAAREINSGANDLSSRTEQEASSLEETAATTEQLAASVKAFRARTRRRLTEAIRAPRAKPATAQKPSSEPARLRQLASEAFGGSARAPRKAAGGSDWAEF